MRQAVECCGQMSFVHEISTALSQSDTPRPAHGAQPVPRTLPCESYGAQPVPWPAGSRLLYIACLGSGMALRVTGVIPTLALEASVPPSCSKGGSSSGRTGLAAMPVLRGKSLAAPRRRRRDNVPDDEEPAAPSQQLRGGSDRARLVSKSRNAGQSGQPHPLTFHSTSPQH